MRSTLPAKTRARGWGGYDLCLILMIATTLAVKLRLVFTLKIGWDEFFFLAKVHSYLAGSLTDRLQTFYVHAFTWLPWVSGNEVSQVVAARLVMFALFLGSCILSYRLARYFFSRSAALFSVLCYVTFSNIVIHGASFRADSISSFLFLLALYVLVARGDSRGLAVLAGVALACALLVTIKSVFYLVTVGLVLLVRLVIAENRKQDLLQIAIGLLSFVVALGCLAALHTVSLPPRDAAGTGLALQNISAKVIVFKESLARFYYLAVAIYENLVTWVLLLLGFVLVLSQLLSRSCSLPKKHGLLVPFFAPILTVAFYRNAFPYYYVFILSPAIVLCGVAMQNVIDGLVGKKPRLLAFFLYFLAVVIFGRFLLGGAFDAPSNRAQFELIEVVHQTFPDAVPYIDGCSAISSYPKVGFFMSTWGMEKYLKADQPIMRDLLKTQSPVFLFANVPSLDLSLPRENSFTAINYALLEEDWQTLRANFIHHWSLIYVAGKDF